MEKKEYDFNIVKSLLKNRFIIREWLKKKEYYLEEDKHESMTHKYLDGVFQGKFFCPNEHRSQGWKV